MSDLTVVTPPDTLLTNNVSFLLVYPSRDVKDEFQNLIMKFDDPFTTYIYETQEPKERLEVEDIKLEKTDVHDYDWLLRHVHVADFVILDIDNCPPTIRDLASYIIANTNTFWLTKAPDMYYNKLSNKRIYHLDYLVEHIGAKLAELQKQTT